MPATGVLTGTSNPGGAQTSYEAPKTTSRYLGSSPTGKALRAVLLGLNPIPDAGAEAQIIRW